MTTFSVIMATYNRGRHILPSIHSVLRQTRQDFELLVVGDCCTDDTADVVRALASPRIRWANLPERGGSQAFPNNAGIEMARGQYIAYLGHDDIWAPDHLQALADHFGREPRPDFVVSGAIFHGPRASNYRWVTGIFSEPDAALKHFFPPSSFGHRRDVVDRIGKWRNPKEITAPVDSDFMLRATRSGMHFMSTQRITVQKFAAGHRYLSYLSQSSDEQDRMVRRMARPGFDGYLASEVAKAKAANAYMVVVHPDYEQFEKGQLATQIATNKGIVRPDLRDLRRREVIRQDNTAKALDWFPLQTAAGWTIWVGCNPRPKLLVPFKYDGKARIRMDIWHLHREALTGLKLAANGQPVAASVSGARQEGDLWTAQATFETALRKDDHTILELHLTRLQRPAGRNGIGVADIEVTPLGWRSIVAKGTQLLAKFRPAR
ncbi:MAG: glycosyltransferase [Mesorhizobium sp.]|uniref:glycosyltransferase family 2 protein n=1 Tax=unclassified Mesorhizobium TaxID=325217 RepID=UPI000F74CC56|nr:MULTISPECIES: glycosyltransferase [unclassified Mesorhizobium]AZO72071.1 glycosyltransferase [Mesorhizobium sp. M1D.F.Ca.ET.043.01.1.1]RWA95031.1 MAG: glycosyltransferase [Mesorhizobium sp.]RWE08889.1 MAG: glycosyltransferase [Mesorhizobium sp.]TIV99567.1 MAG: glycosyltransferase [Mesorhizobium sp.]TJW82110.1 MAG: glycosyltransferase [Mesorhizobium sp.]